MTWVDFSFRCLHVSDDLAVLVMNIPEDILSIVGDCLAKDQAMPTWVNYRCSSRFLSSLCWPNDLDAPLPIIIRPFSDWWLQWPMPALWNFARTISKAEHIQFTDCDDENEIARLTGKRDSLVCDAAACIDNLEYVEFLVDTCHKNCDYWSMVNCTGHHKTTQLFEWALKRYFENHEDEEQDFDRPPCFWILDMAAEFDQVAVVQYLLSDAQIYYPRLRIDDSAACAIVCNRACDYGNMRLLKWLLANHYDRAMSFYQSRPQIVSAVVELGYTSILWVLLREGVHFDSHILDQYLRYQSEYNRPALSCLKLLQRNLHLCSEPNLFEPILRTYLRDMLLLHIGVPKRLPTVILLLNMGVRVDSEMVEKSATCRADIWRRLVRIKEMA